MNNELFPFSAIVGQHALKLALMLCAVDPKIGGVLLSGARGTAKSTVARALLALMPVDGGQFVSLPLGVSEERITGTLNLEKVLADGSVVLSEGLLQKAHRGILYVDEVNLLADHLVDLLLDVAASGVNTVERDGISQQHAAQFVLVGTMNPEEGELRPQLLDRYGLCVAVSDDYNAAQRVEIVRARLAFDTDPQQFIAGFAERQTQLQRRCHQARALLPTVSVDDDSLNAIAARCISENVEGVRADIVIYRAARAHAALQGRDRVDRSDIDAVAELALLHRRRESPQKQAPDSHDNTATQHERVPPDSSQAGAGDWGEMPPQPIATGEQRVLSDSPHPVEAGKKKTY